MAYVGPAPNPGQNREVDDISSGFNGGTAAFTLQVNGQNVSPGSSNNIIVSLGGVIQNPGTDYTIAGSTITFTTNPASGLSFFGLVLGQQVDIQSVSDSASIVSPTLSNPSVTGELTQTVSVDGKGIVLNAANLKPMITGNSNRSAENNTIIGFSGKWNNTEVARIAVEAGPDTTNKDDGSITFSTRLSGAGLTKRLSIEENGAVLPGANNTYDLGSSSLRWANLYTNDLNLSNEGSSNDVDGTWGNYTIQEGAEDLFLINKRNGKKYKFNLTEVG